ncbi:DUF6221 family protein [Streptomyces hygroscopicus]|uniref:DUF6221 family protein n=1 Tax=Streptomyces hygroscopicus TaxID=1912 RepID=UPI003825E6FD
MSDGLVEFLRARLDEDERRAQDGYYSDTHWERFTTEAHLGAWQAWRQYFPREQWDVKANDAVSEAARDAIRKRITAHEANRSARILAEVEAKRQVIYDWEEHVELDAIPDLDHELEARATHKALAWLARPYASHPDYREEWRP